MYMQQYNSSISAEQIRDQSLALGYAKCGIVGIDAVADYADRLDERIAAVPRGRLQFGKFRRFARPGKGHPWAKSIIVLVSPYSGYNVPKELRGMYAKTYLFDPRLDEHSEEFKRRRRFMKFLDEIGIRHVGEEKFGITALRWAAQKAGLGTIRHNNFFYTPEHGSYVSLDAFLIDLKLEWIEKDESKPCPPNCGKCIEGCPSRSLNAPYTMSLVQCVSFQTSLSSGMPCMGVPSETMVEQIGGRLYGCDVCQDVCPFNKGKMTGGTDFPGLAELAPLLKPEKIMAMSYDEIARSLCPKFWYIDKKNLWKWKLNALTVMRNNYRPEYEAAIKLGLCDQYVKVRRFAKKTCEQLKIKRDS